VIGKFNSTSQKSKSNGVSLWCGEHVHSFQKVAMKGNKDEPFPSKTTFD